MFYYLSFLRDIWMGFNLFRYVTFRTGGAFFTSFFLIFFFWVPMMKFINRLKVHEHINMYGHEQLEKIFSCKKNTPTMGGLMIIFSIVFSVLLWCRWDNDFIWYCIVGVILMGLLGFRDDWQKLRRTKGLTRKEKFIGQLLIGAILGLLLVLSKGFTTELDLPFFKDMFLDLGYFYIFWAMLVITASSNAVNFTDGLDGLSIGGIITNFLVLAIFSYLSSHFRFAQYLFIPYISGGQEVTVLCGSVLGASLGFLWFNSHPAQIFMGDTGALALGGLLGLVSLIIKKEFLLIISGGLFVIEALSVIIQILSVRIFKKKVFLASPLHHHLQLLGWSESKIIIRLWIISIIFAVCTILTLKLR